MPSQDIQVLDGKVSVNPKPQHPSGFVQAGKCKLIIQIPAFDVAKMPLTSCSQSLGTINPVLPQKFRKPWKRIKASCLFTGTELEKLKKYGPWLRALHSAKLSAKSKFEKHFESVCRRKIEPKYDIEAIWQRYIDCRLVETPMRRLHRNHVDYSSVRSSMEQFKSKGNPFASEWLAVEGEWDNEPSVGYSKRSWREGATCKAVNIVRG